MTVRHGDDRLPPKIWNRIIVDDAGCWIWTGTIGINGYGCLSFAGRHSSSHRFVYQSLIGPIQNGLHIDHLCRVRACCNPAHLEPVTPLENHHRGNGDWQATKTHCPVGHPYDEPNTYVDRFGYRRCRACNRERARNNRTITVAVVTGIGVTR